MTITSRSEQLANRYQRGANALSWLRIAAAPVLAERIISSENSYRSWALAGSIAVLGATDKLDGWMGRKSSRLLDGLGNVRGAWLDQLSDKVFVHGVLGSLVVKEAVHGSKTLAAVYGVNQAAIIARDIWVTGARSDAANNDIDVKARPLGKLKTAAQLATMAVITTPIFNSEDNLNQLVQSAAVSGTTALAIASGISLVRDISSASESAKQSAV